MGQTYEDGLAAQVKTKGEREQIKNISYEDRVADEYPSGLIE